MTNLFERVAEIRRRGLFEARERFSRLARMGMATREDLDAEGVAFEHLMAAIDAEFRMKLRKEA